MVDFHDYERTRKRQAIAILAVVGVPAAALAMVLAVRTGDGRTAVLPGLIAVVSLYAAWDLSRVVVDPDSMHVEAIDAGSRQRRFVRSAALLALLFTCWIAIAWWIESPSLWQWQLPGFLFALVTEGVYLAVTDTRLVDGADEVPRRSAELPRHPSGRLN